MAYRLLVIFYHQVKVPLILTELVTIAEMSFQMIFSAEAFGVVTARIERAFEVFDRDCIMPLLMAPEIFRVLKEFFANIAPVFP